MAMAARPTRPAPIDSTAQPPQATRGSLGPAHALARLPHAVRRSPGPPVRSSQAARKGSGPARASGAAVAPTRVKLPPSLLASSPAGPSITLKDPRAAKDPRFQKVMSKLQQSAAQTKRHPSPQRKAAEAQAAALPPANEKLAGAQANQVDTMQSAKSKKPEADSFLALLRAEIAKIMPKTLGDTENFMQGDQPQTLKSTMTGNVNQQKEDASGEIKAASNQAPDTSKVEGKAVTPLPAEDATPTPPALGAAEAVPEPKPECEVSLQQSKQDTDQQLKDAEVTPGQLQEANDPRFSAVLTARSSVEKQADSAPKEFRSTEQKTLSQEAAKAVSDEKQGLTALRFERGKAGPAVKLKQLTAKQKDEARRKEVTDTIEKIYSETKQKVEAKLASLENDVSSMFDKGIEDAMTKMKSYIDQKMDAYKDDRYGGIGGGLLWASDKLFGMPDEVNVYYETGRKLFMQDLDTLVVSISRVVETRLKEAKDEIAKGQARIRDYVKSLPKDLQEVGKAAEKEVAGRFEEMSKGVDEKKNALAQKLAQRYKEATDKANEQLKKMQEENKGLVTKFVEKLGEIIKILREFKERVTSMLKKGKDTIMLIVAHPIRFLGYLIDAIKQGVLQFSRNILKHLQKGLMDWLFGSLAEAGIEIPSDFSLGSILKLVLQVLGLTYDRIRAKAVKLIGERNVMLLEKAWQLISALIKGGPAALWEQIKEFLGNLKEMVIQAIEDWIVEKVIRAAITKLISMFNPVGAIIQAIMAIYNTVMFFIERIQQILAFVEAIINSVYKIATGDIASAANWIEQALARFIPVIISFLARLLGLTGIAEKIKETIKKIQDTVDKAIDKLIEKVVAGIGKLFGKGKAGEAGKADPEHDAKVKAGLEAIDREDANYKKDGKIDRADAEKVAAKVKQVHPIFKSITVVDGGETWDYEYVASKGEKKGEKKGGSAELQTARAEFRKRLFTREELETVLKVSKTTALNYIGQWKTAGTLYQLATTTFDTFTQYSFDKNKGGERDIISENKRELYGYKNPAKDSSEGLQVLSKGLRSDSPTPILKDDATYHKTRARYDSVVKGSSYHNFRYPDAILGHKPPGASGHWNKIGHKQTRADNQAWNKDPRHYQGPEHKEESAASGASAARYRIPSKAAGSHSDWWP